MKKVWLGATLLLGFFSVMNGAEPTAASAEPQMVPTAAVLPFESRERRAADEMTGKSVAELLTAALMESGCVDMVERAELDKALDELHLSAAGMTDRESQLKLGQFVGAKILITGSLFQSGDKRVIVAKIIGAETSRVMAASVSSTGPYTEMVPALSKKIADVLDKCAARLLPKRTAADDVVARLAETVRGGKRKVFVSIKEDIQVQVPDPAAETEIKKLLLDLGFEITGNRSEAVFEVIGEAFAAMAGTFRDLAAAEARVELSVYAGQKLLATGARKDTSAGASYPVAAKDALGQAALGLAGDLFGVMK